MVFCDESEKRERESKKFFNSNFTGRERRKRERPKRLGALGRARNGCGVSFPRAAANCKRTTNHSSNDEGEEDHLIGSIKGAHFGQGSMSENDLRPVVRVATWNILSNWWYVYKVYDRATPKADRHWEPSRRELTESYFESLRADVVCIQEINPNSFESDFKFAERLGYDHVLEQSNNRYMRTAVFFRRSKFKLAKEKTGFKFAAVRLEHIGEERPSEGTITEEKKENPAEAIVDLAPLHVLSVHLSAAEPKIGVKQLAGALKSVKSLMANDEDPNDVSLIVAGDFNLLDIDSNDAPVIHFLKSGMIGKSYSYGRKKVSGNDSESTSSADAKESELEYKSKKNTRHPFGNVNLLDAAEALGQARPTFIVADLFGKFKTNDETFTPEFYKAVDSIFEQSSSKVPGSGVHDTRVMTGGDIETWIRRLHGTPEVRGIDGANQEKLALKIVSEKLEAQKMHSAAANGSEKGGAAEETSDTTTDNNAHVLTLSDFHRIYETECDVNPWSVEYDFLEFDVDWEDSARVRPLFKRRLDRIFFSDGTLRLHASEEQAAFNEKACKAEAEWIRTGRPVIPNEFHPSDHTAVLCEFVMLPARPKRTSERMKKGRKETQKKGRSKDQ